MTWDDTKTFTTPEQVAVTYRLAGIGTRFAATLVDTLLHVLLLLAFLLAWGLLTIGLSEVADRIIYFDEQIEGWLVPVVVIGLFALFWGYFIFWETIWNGQTPGKRLCGIRVLRDRGFPIDFRAAFLRNILRYIDFLPMGYGVGALTVFLSRDSKRLGDYAAGTIVVVDAAKARRAGAAPPPPAEPPTEYRLLGDPALLNLRAITREQFAVVERYLSRRSDLVEKVRADLARQIAAPLIPLIGMPPAAEDYPFDLFLTEFAAAYRQRAG